MNSIYELNQNEIISIAGGNAVIDWAKNHPYLSITIGASLLLGTAAIFLLPGAATPIIPASASIAKKILLEWGNGRRPLEALDMIHVLNGGKNPIYLSFFEATQALADFGISGA